MFDYKKKIGRVLFELSNLCQYAPVHKKCPLYSENMPIILPSAVVYKVLDSISCWKYSGRIGFHTYNEPGIDPRLFIMIEYARKKCPESYISIMSNGFYLDSNLLDEYQRIGVDEMILSAYSLKDYERFSAFKTCLKLKIQKPSLDDRLDIYKRKELLLNKPCSAPYNELMITREGYVGLCCLDWNKTEIFGNLNVQKLDDILGGSKMIDAYNKLIKGDRELNICKRCDWSR